MKEGLILCVLSKTSHLNEAKPQFATRLSRIIKQKHYLTNSLNGNLFYNHISMQAQANYMIGYLQVCTPLTGSQCPTFGLKVDNL